MWNALEGRTQTQMQNFRWTTGKNLCVYRLQAHWGSPSTRQEAPSKTGCPFTTMKGLWKEWTLLKTTTRWPHSMRLWSWHVQFKVWDVKGGKSDTGGERNATPRCVYGFVIKSHFRHFTGPTCHGLGQCKTEAHTTFKVVNGKTLLGHKGTNGRWKPVCLARIRNL